MNDKLIHIPELKDGGAADSALPTNERPSLLFNIPRSYVLIFFLVYLTIGVSVYQDYGISWDEPVDMTAEWYKMFYSGASKGSVYLLCTKQIAKYVKMARERSSRWTEK